MHAVGGGTVGTDTMSHLHHNTSDEEPLPAEEEEEEYVPEYVPTKEAPIHALENGGGTPDSEDSDVLSTLIEELDSNIKEVIWLIEFSKNTTLFAILGKHTIFGTEERDCHLRLLYLPPLHNLYSRRSRSLPTKVNLSHNGPRLGTSSRGFSTTRLGPGPS